MPTEPVSFPTGQPVMLEPPKTPAPDDGLVGRVGRFLFGRSWRTTVLGIVAAGALLEPTVMGLVEGRITWGQAIPQVIAALSVAALGRVSKDTKVSGTP